MRKKSKKILIIFVVIFIMEMLGINKVFGLIKRDYDSSGREIDSHYVYEEFLNVQKNAILGDFWEKGFDKYESYKTFSWAEQNEIFSGKRLILRENILGEGGSEPVLYFYWRLPGNKMTHLNNYNIPEEELVRLEVVGNTDQYDYTYPGVRIRFNTNSRHAMFFNYYDSNERKIKDNGEDTGLGLDFLMQAYFFSMKRHVQDEKLNNNMESLSTSDINKLIKEENFFKYEGIKDSEWELMKAEKAYSNIIRQNGLTAAKLKEFCKTARQDMNNLHTSNEQKQNENYELSNNVKDGECNFGETFEVTIQGNVQNGTENSVQILNLENLEKIGWVENTTDRYKLKVKDNPDGGTAKFTIRYNYEKYDAYYDFFKNRAEAVVVDPGEKRKAVYKDQTITLTIKPKVKVKQYIFNYDENSNGNGMPVQYLKKENGTWKMHTTSGVGDRKSWNEKKEKPVIIENGCRIVYKVEVTNEGSGTVYVKLKDTLPAILKGKVEIRRDGQDPVRMTLTTEDHTIKPAEWPGSDDETENLTIPGGKTITFTIVGHVSADSTSPNYYKPDNPLEAEAQITAVRTQNVYSGKHNFIDEDSKPTSCDYFTLKKYNVSVDKYISQVKRADGTVISSGGLVENANYAVGNKREGKEDEIKLANPVCIEKGDRVVYTIKIKNEANNKTPCFLPNEVNVWLNDVLPGNGKNIISIKKGNSELDYTQLNNEDRNTQKKCEFR